MKLSRIFRSRWSALFWSAGVIWTAYDVAQSAPHHGVASTNQSALADATGESYSPADIANLANAVGD